MSIDRSRGSVSPVDLLDLKNQLQIAHENIRVLTDVLNACVQKLNGVGRLPVKEIILEAGPTPRLRKL